MEACDEGQMFSKRSYWAPRVLASVGPSSAPSCTTQKVSNIVLIVSGLLWEPLNVVADDRVVLRDELETAMRLCGITDLNQVRGDISWLNTAELQQYLPPTSIVKGGLFGLFRSKL